MARQYASLRSELSSLVKTIERTTDIRVRLTYSMQLLRTILERPQHYEVVVRILEETGDATRRRVGYLAEQLSHLPQYHGLRALTERVHDEPQGDIYLIDRPSEVLRRLEGLKTHDEIGQRWGVIAYMTPHELDRLYRQVVRRTEPMYASK